MTAIKAYNLWCDHPDCRNTDPFDSDAWPHWRTAAAVRTEARRQGWRRTRDGRDICPEHAKTTPDNA